MLGGYGRCHPESYGVFRCKAAPAIQKARLTETTVPRACARRESACRHAAARIGPVPLQCSALSCMLYNIDEAGAKCRRSRYAAKCEFTGVMLEYMAKSKHWRRPAGLHDDISRTMLPIRKDGSHLPPCQARMSPPNDDKGLLASRICCLLPSGVKQEAGSATRSRLPTVLITLDLRKLSRSSGLGSGL